MRGALEKWLRAKGDFVGEKGIAGLLDGLFAAEREEASEQIRAHMPVLSSSRGVLADAPRDAPAARRNPPRARQPGRFLHYRVDAVVAGRPDRKPCSPARPQEGLGRAGGDPHRTGGGDRFRGGGPPPGQPIPATGAATTPERPSSAWKLVHVAVHASPDAVITLDGAPVANPLVRTSRATRSSTGSESAAPATRT